MFEKSNTGISHFASIRILRPGRETQTVCERQTFILSGLKRSNVMIGRDQPKEKQVSMQGLKMSGSRMPCDGTGRVRVSHPTRNECSTQSKALTGSVYLIPALLGPCQLSPRLLEDKEAKYVESQSPSQRGRNMQPKTLSLQSEVPSRQARELKCSDPPK